MPATDSFVVARRGGNSRSRRLDVLTASLKAAVCGASASCWLGKAGSGRDCNWRCPDSNAENKDSIPALPCNAELHVKGLFSNVLPCASLQLSHEVHETGEYDKRGNEDRNNHLASERASEHDTRHGNSSRQTCDLTTALQVQPTNAFKHPAIKQDSCSPVGFCVRPSSSKHRPGPLCCCSCP